MKRNICSIIIALLLIVISYAQTPRSVESIASNYVSIIKFGAGGKVWAGTPGYGCAVFDSSLNVWTNFSAINTPMKSDTVTAIELYPIGLTPHSFMATSKGVYYRHGASWDSVPGLMNIQVTGIIKSPDGNLYVSTLSGVSVYDADSLYHIADYNTGNSNIPYNKITTLQYKQVNAGGFYAATSDSGYFYTNDLVSYTKVNTSNSNIVDDRINCLLVKSDATKQYAGTKGGLSVCSNGVCNNFTTSNGLRQNDVTAVELDFKGNMWVGTRDSGICIYNGTTFTYVNIDNVLPSNKIRAINCKASGECWVGMEDKGIIVLDTSYSVLQIFNGVKEVEESYEVTIFPQPAKDIISFTIPEAISHGELSLFDISGKLVANRRINNSDSIQMDIKSLQEGFYFYSIRSGQTVLKTGKISIIR